MSTDITVSQFSLPNTFEGRSQPYKHTHFPIPFPVEEDFWFKSILLIAQLSGYGCIPVSSSRIQLLV
jgi:hypothetical protein